MKHRFPLASLPLPDLLLVKSLSPFGDVGGMIAPLPAIAPPAIHAKNPHASAAANKFVTMPGANAMPTPKAAPSNPWHGVSPTDAAEDHSLRQHSSNGVLHPDRAALHDHIVNHFLSGADHSSLSGLYKDFEDPQNKPKPRAIFTMGGSGSGKSYYAEKKFLKHPRFALVDPDAVKKHIPEYDPLDAEPVHGESSHIAKRIQDEAHKRGVSYVYDGTGANAGSFSKKIQQAKDAGYHVEIHRAVVPLDTALKRNSMRERKMPEHIVRKLHSTVEDSFHKVKHLADKVRVFDTSTEDKSPFAVRRHEIIGSRGENEVQKGMSGHNSHHSHGGDHHGEGSNLHHYHPKLAKSAGLKKIEIDIPGEPPHFMIGHLEKGHITVKDVVHDGVSEHAMTGKHPALKPIPLEVLEKRFPWPSQGH